MRKTIFLIIILLSGNLFASKLDSKNDYGLSNMQELNIDKISREVKSKTNELRKQLDKKVHRTIFKIADEFISDIVQTTSGVYYEKMGKDQITKEFKNLTTAQVDVLNFYLLARVASELDRKNFLAEEDSLRLQLYRDRRDKLYTTLAGMMEKIANVPENQIKKIR